MIVGHSLFFFPEIIMEALMARLGLRQVSNFELGSGSVVHFTAEKSGALRRCRIKLASNRRGVPTFANDMRHLSFHANDLAWRALVKFSKEKNPEVLSATSWQYDSEWDCVCRFGDAEQIYLSLEEIKELDMRMELVGIHVETGAE